MGRIVSESEAQTREIGEKLAGALSEFDIVALYGELGSGKTQFIKGICSRLGVKDIVNSPTFVIVNEYLSAAGKKIFHFDLYRMKSNEEVIDMGFRDYLNTGLILIEWPELIENLLPQTAKRIYLSHYGEETNRRVIESMEV